MADEADHWARAVESFTGYTMPSRNGMFDDVTALQPNGNGGGSPMMPPKGGMRGGGESPSERERSSPGPRVSRTSMRRGPASAQADRRAAATPDEDVVTTRSRTRGRARSTSRP
ncbi:hypothetical protein ACJ6WF_27155 [Streptomyces sp. MMS24-I2-30]|uniref:hypothetical protein n=1 Tax=Streptomyces sp. MMS24-I2-30 TaxID=3351564 RepID=UPI003896B349